jgi:hypothetical protein
VSDSWRVIGASVIGTSHQSRRSVCQDAHAFRALDDGTVILAVADGAGSASRSAEGAAAAVEAAAEFLSRNLCLTDALSAARCAVEQLASEDAAIEAFATTLLLVAITASEIAIAQIGDGSIVVQHRDGSLDVLTEASRAEYANHTTFLTAPDALAEAAFASRPADGVRGVAVMTDGMQMLAVRHDNNQAFPAFFTPVFRFAADPSSNDAGVAEFLMSSAVNSRTDDDKTLVLATRL